VGSAGCGDDGSGAPAQETQADAGEPRRDAGPPLVWRPRDASAWDAGTTTATAPDATVDARECAMVRMPLPDAVLPRCKAETRSCIADCASAADADACRDGCIAADDSAPEPTYGLDCSACIYLQLFACIDQAGCREGVADLFCCIADECPTGSPEGCGETQCGAELEAAVTCGYFADMSCIDFLTGGIDQCYATASDADAGT
jgi:hypothetical protein